VLPAEIFQIIDVLSVAAPTRRSILLHALSIGYTLSHSYLYAVQVASHISLLLTMLRCYNNFVTLPLNDVIITMSLCAKRQK